MSARTMVPEQTLAQIGRMNLMAISGFRWGMESGDMILPISSGYRVRISLDANDTYTVTREMKRGDKIFVKGTMSDIYAEDLGEVCYQASSYKSNDWGGHTVGSKQAGALPNGMDWGYDFDEDYLNVEGAPALVITVYDENGEVVDSVGGFEVASLDVSDHGNVNISNEDEAWLQERALEMVGSKTAESARPPSEDFDLLEIINRPVDEDELYADSANWGPDPLVTDPYHGPRRPEETTAMTHPHREAQLLEALEYATPREAVRITTELDGLRRAARLRHETGRALDWDAVHSGVPGGPVPPGIHTAATDWMADAEPVVTPDKVKTAALNEARRWLLHADPFVMGHPEELEKQALDHASVWSSRFANSNLAHRSFVGSLTDLLSAR